MKTYELLIFDFDGTLVDTVPDIAHHANAVLKDYGFPGRGIEAVKKAIGRGVHELLKELAPELGQDEARLEEAVRLFKDKYHRAPVVHTAPFPGVIELLRGPLGPVKKAIVTNKPYDLTLLILDHFVLADRFEIVIGMGQEHPPKPDPASVRFVLQKTQTAQAQAVMIGDSHIDRETAEKAGIDFIWMDYGYDSPGSYRVRRFAEASAWKSLVSG